MADQARGDAGAREIDRAPRGPQQRRDDHGIPPLQGVAEAEKILLDDYIFAPLAIFPTRHLVQPTVKGYDASIAGYNNSQFMTLE